MIIINLFDFVFSLIFIYSIHFKWSITIKSDRTISIIKISNILLQKSQSKHPFIFFIILHSFPSFSNISSLEKLTIVLLSKMNDNLGKRQRILHSQTYCSVEKEFPREHMNIKIWVIVSLNKKLMMLKWYLQSGFVIIKKQFFLQ